MKKLERAGLKIEIWGKCGNKMDPAVMWDGTLVRHRHNEHDSLIAGNRSTESEFFSRYRFFLSLENSLCDDYLTEKAYYGMYTSYLSGTIPIMFGKGDYEATFPYGGFLKITKLSDVNKLISQIRYFKDPNNEDQLRNMYYWLYAMNPRYERGKELMKQTGTFHGFQMARYANSFAWKELCRKLWNTKADERAISSFDHFMEHMGQCSDMN